MNGAFYRTSLLRDMDLGWSEPVWVDHVVLNRALAWVARAVSKDSTRPHLCGVRCHPSGYLEATDGSRLHRWTWPDHGVPACLMPVSVIKELKDLSGAQFSIAHTSEGALLHLRNLAHIITAGCVSFDRYPPTDQVIPLVSNMRATMTMPVRTLKTMVRELTARTCNDTLRLIYTGEEELRLYPYRKYGADGVTVDDSLVRHCSLDAGSLVRWGTPDSYLVDLHPAYLLDTMSGVRSGEVCIRSAGGELDPVMVAIGDERLAIIMPKRM